LRGSEEILELPNFKRVMRGYDPEEVDKAWAEFQRNLAEANASNRELRLQVNSLREQNNEWGNRLKSYEKMELDLRDALLSAQRVANQVRDEAKRNAEQVLEQARIDAESRITETQLQADRQLSELEESTAIKTKLLSDLEEKISELSTRKEILEERMDKAQVQLEYLQRLLSD
jgi:cell division initiation protein